MKSGRVPETKATVVNISYRLAPALKFSTAPNDVWDSLLWILRDADSLGADPTTGFILGGVSAGANIAAVIAQKTIEEKISLPLTSVWLSTPLAPILNMEAIKRLQAAYSPDISSPDYSPFNAKDTHKGLPPVYLQVCSMDPLRDYGLIYEKVLREHGVKTEMVVYPGLPHGYLSFTGLKSAQKGSIDSV
ncbi:Alpha/Beta hydrolase protein [Ilyonectria destructans]|nr:Alpha/Beta hydrolase protein [Ilyonectria destructans]